MEYTESLNRYKKIVSLKERGFSYAEIGRLFSISRQRVEQIHKAAEPKERDFIGGILKKYNQSHLEGRERARALVRIRDNYTCQDCGMVRTYEAVQRYNKQRNTLRGKMKQLDVHHTHGMCGKNSIGYDSPKEISKMVTLCHRCHFNRPEHKTNNK